MRWIIFVIFAYVVVGLEQGLSSVLANRFFYDATPCLLLVLAVYIGFWAPGATVAWSWLILGLLYDLSHPLAVPGTNLDAVILGPGALGFLAGALAILQLRGMIYRGSALALALAVFVVGILVELVIAFLLTARGLPFTPFPGERIITETWSGQCVRAFFVLLYSALAALPLGWVLLRSTPLWGFSGVKGQGHHYGGFTARR